MLFLLRPEFDPESSTETKAQGMQASRARHRRAMIAAMLMCVLGGLGGAPRAEVLGDEDRIRIAYTPRVFHLSSNRNYVDWNHIVALELITPRHARWGADRSHFGLSLFDNSYGQFSQSIYAGLEWDWKPALGGELFFSVSVGLVHGYREPYEDRVPLNSALGVGVTVVPAIGWQRERLGAALSLPGSAVALRVSWSFLGSDTF